MNSDLPLRSGMLGFRNLFPVIGALAYLLVGLYLSPDLPVLEPDSLGYIGYSVDRTPLYPMLLKMFGGEGDNLSSVIIAQLLFFSATFLLLLRSASFLRYGKIISAFVFLIVLVNPYLYGYHFTILTESIFSSLINLFVASIVLIGLGRRSNYVWVLLGGVVGASILLRPVGYAFLPVIPIVMFALWRIEKKLLLRQFGGAICIVFLMILGGYFIHGYYHADDKGQMIARHLYAKSALIDAGASTFKAGTLQNELWDAAENHLAPVRRVIEEAEGVNPGVEKYLRQNYEAYVQYRFVTSALLPLANEEGIAPAMTEVGWSRVKSNIDGYARLVAKTFGDMWMPFSESFPPYVTSGNKAFPDIALLPFNQELQAINRDMVARSISYAGYPLLLIAGMISVIVIALGGIFLVVSPARAEKLFLPWTIAVTINGYFLLISLTGIGVARYALVMFPVIGLMNLMICGSIWDLLVKRFSIPKQTA